jgi:hypothetical protein
MIVSSHVRMEEESLRQAKVWAAKLGMSYSDFAGHAIASECINRDLVERELLAHFPAKQAARRKAKR